MPTFHKLPEAIYLLRRRRGLTGKEVALAADITEAMFSGYQSGERTPSLLTLGKLLDAFGVSLAELDSVLNQLTSSQDTEPDIETAPQRPAGGVFTSGHVVTEAEAENLRLLRQALFRLDELGVDRAPK